MLIYKRAALSLEIPKELEQKARSRVFLAIKFTSDCPDFFSLNSHA
ncbi:hypothetical protein LEP1GSC170_3476 [Leptospira interrogans serovar Bataviae str. HAI135]|nr:hypothetical protein LEP1GSC170_3476 [Leptospira interrogans serovar Bataviae str. HAI135]